MFSIIYSELLKKYADVLISTSRGFDRNHEFLETWVPNIDINYSVSDLINSAIDYNTKKFEIILTKEELEKLDSENLIKKFSNYCSINLTTKGITIFLEKIL
jgi:hypothetical protein